MVFSSFPFLIWFLPFFLAIYHTAPVKTHNFVLLLFSLVFYAYGCSEHPLYFLLLVCSVFLNWVLGLLISKSKVKKFWLLIGLILDFGFLFVFKYLDFAISGVNRISSFFASGSLNLYHLNLVLPIGISFFTFQIVSYLIDVYRGTVPVEKNIIDLGAYIIAFPQLIAGPIVKYGEIYTKLHDRFVNKEYIFRGIELFIFGLGFKVLLANRLAGLWTEVSKIGYSSLSVPMAWMGIFGYSLQLYFDFYGYSLMAIGLGKMLGFDIPENFRTPYVSLTMTEFWTRWHITLGSWFREYVYIPLGGNRKGNARTFLNLFTVWMLTAIWHGAGVNFLLWGLFLALIIIAEKAVYGKFLERHSVFGHIYMIILIPVSWLLFALDSMGDIKDYLCRLVGAGGEYVFAEDWLKNGKLYLPFLVIGVILATPVGKKIYERIKSKPVIIPVLIAITAGTFYCLYKGLNDPFMYFRF
ncbi:MAG: MBOAT family protein [Clostridia bacterium]|nr:MBOAT family protein [Clostridia bacterium]